MQEVLLRFKHCKHTCSKHPFILFYHYYILELSFILRVLFCFRVFCLFVLPFLQREWSFVEVQITNLRWFPLVSVSVASRLTDSELFFCANFSAWDSQECIGNENSVPTHSFLYVAQTRGSTSLEDFFFTHRVGLLAYFQQLPWVCRFLIWFV